MLKQLQEKKIEKLERELGRAHRVIEELILALDTSSEELRLLTRDVATSYMETVYENLRRTDSTSV